MTVPNATFKTHMIGPRPKTSELRDFTHMLASWVPHAATITLTTSIPVHRATYNHNTPNMAPHEPNLSVPNPTSGEAQPPQNEGTAHAPNSPSLFSTAPYIAPLTGTTQLATNGSKIPNEMASSSEPTWTDARTATIPALTTGARHHTAAHTWSSIPICAPRPAPQVSYSPTPRIAAIRDSIYAALFAR
jgi:hypothetical protein